MVRADDSIVIADGPGAALSFASTQGRLSGKSLLRGVDVKLIVGVLVFSAVFVLPVSAAFAQDSKTTVIVPSVVPMPANPTQQTVENEKMVCKAPRPMMGTRFLGPRICKTQRQWNAEHYEAKEALEKDQSRGCLSSGVCPQ